MEEVKFSILIPAFKARFLKECLCSILGQSYSNFEVIIVNDASPEDLDDIVASFKDGRFFYYKNNKNCGAEHVVDNWNKCLKLSSGDYIICMGDDDKLLPNCLQEYYMLIKKYPDIGLVHGWTEIIDENSCHVTLTAPRPERESLYSILWNRWDNRKQQFIGDWCFNRKWLTEKGGFYKLPFAWGSDDISALLGAARNGVANTQSLCFQYRVNCLTISRTGAIKGKLEAIKLEKEWYLQLLKEPPTNKVDKLYYNDIKKMMGAYYDKKFGLYISTALKHNVLNIFKYYALKNKYGYSCRAIGHAIYLALH